MFLKLFKPQLSVRNTFYTMTQFTKTPIHTHLTETKVSRNSTYQVACTLMFSLFLSLSLFFKCLLGLAGGNPES